jgi:transposase InsO family protein
LRFPCLKYLIVGEGDNRPASKRKSRLLRISRGSVYYLPRLTAEGYKIGRRHVKTLMRRMVIEALYRRPHTTIPEPGHKIYPYLLRGMEVARPNQVWAMDITYIPMARGFVYLAVVLD